MASTVFIFFIRNNLFADAPKSKTIGSSGALDNLMCVVRVWFVLD